MIEVIRIKEKDKQGKERINKERKGKWKMD
jgi:hypothetical protein